VLFAMCAFVVNNGVHAATATTPPSSPRSAGILYEVWHSAAAMSMAQVKEHNQPQLTVETVIRSNGKHTLNDVFPPAKNTSWYSGDIYNVEPAELGFYCLYRARDEAACNKTVPPTPYFPPPFPDCPMATEVAIRHASLLHGAGFDYVAIDITNWPQVNAATDEAVLRPLEVLFDEWLHGARFLTGGFRGVPLSFTPLLRLKRACV
jgi:hypothetical protein